mgnify:CR=1
MEVGSDPNLQTKTAQPGGFCAVSREAGLFQKLVSRPGHKAGNSDSDDAHPHWHEIRVYHETPAAE